MSDIRREKTPVSQLDTGMFVCELDRPWLGTPFLLEGLLIEDDEQIATIKSLCEFVYVDRTFSVGHHYLAPGRQKVAIKHETSQSHFITHARQPNQSVKKQPAKTNVSFFDVLKEIKASNRALNYAEEKNRESENVLLNVRSIDNKTNLSSASVRNDGPSLASQIKTDFSNFVSSLRYWGQKQNNTHLKDHGGKDIADMAATNPANGTGSSTDEQVTVEEEIAVVYPVYEQSQIATREIFEALAQDQKIDLSKVDEALSGMVESIERNPDALIWLAKLKHTDNYSYNHALNVSITLMALANFMSLPKKQVKDLGLAGLLQDIGKVKIPIELLQKEEQITEEEFDLLKKHVDYALELLEVTDNIPATVILTVAQHHERMDGSGYPFKLADKQISLMGQLAGLVDTYCAITSSKAYAKGLYNQVALEQIYALRDTKFQGLLIDQLVQFMGMYPVTSLVELNTGEVAVVIQQNSVRRLLPRVMILLNPDKTKNEYPATINLINAPPTPTGEPYSIVRGLAPDSYGLDISNYFG